LAGFLTQEFSSSSILPYHKSNQLLYYSILNHFRSPKFVNSSFHIPSSMISIFHPKICDIHYHHLYHRDPKCLISFIWIPTDRSQHLSYFLSFTTVGLWVLRLEGSQKFSNPNKYHSSPSSSCISQYTFKNGLMLLTHHASSIKIVINKRRA